MSLYSVSTQYWIITHFLIFFFFPSFYFKIELFYFFCQVERICSVIRTYKHQWGKWLEYCQTISRRIFKYLCPNLLRISMAHGILSMVGHSMWYHQPHVLMDCFSNYKPSSTLSFRVFEYHYWRLKVLLQNLLEFWRKTRSRSLICFYFFNNCHTLYLVLSYYS